MRVWKLVDSGRWRANWWKVVLAEFLNNVCLRNDCWTAIGSGRSQHGVSLLKVHDWSLTVREGKSAFQYRSQGFSSEPFSSGLLAAFWLVEEQNFSFPVIWVAVKVDSFCQMIATFRSELNQKIHWISIVLDNGAYKFNIALLWFNWISFSSLIVENFICNCLSELLNFRKKRNIFFVSLPKSLRVSLRSGPFYEQ